MDCKFVAESKDQDKLMKKAIKHLRKKHKMLEVTPDMQTKARAAIKTVT
jgi:predicted small metal-binding protein